jgi:hypothetical protein
MLAPAPAIGMIEQNKNDIERFVQLKRINGQSEQTIFTQTNELSRIAHRAVETRKRNIKHARGREAGLKAWKETLEPIEYGYIAELARMLKLSKNRIFHHEGLPDIMAVANEGKLRFYELKPKRGS